MKYLYFLVLLVPGKIIFSIKPRDLLIVYYFYLYFLLACVDAIYNCDYTPKCLEINSGDGFVFSEEEIKARCKYVKKI